MRINFIRGAVQLPELDLWLDAHEPCTGPERVFISHAHSDHVAAHREAILSEPTSKLMQARIPGERLEHVLRYREPHEFAHSGRAFRITLFPAGHIFGSAMALIEHGHGPLLYTGDFKLRQGLSAELCEPVAADILIMETTFGRPHYVFPPVAEVMNGVVRFCREALDNDETPVLLGYSLGKSQELLCGLGDARLPLMLHGTVWRLTRIYEQFGHCFPPCEKYQAGTARGKVLLCPPNVVNSAMLRNLGKFRAAILTGWAVDPGARYRYQCDAAFPLSDHADFPELLELVKRVNPKKVYTLHGFAAEFAQTLRDLGWDAQSLSEDEQLALPLAVSATRPAVEGAAQGPRQSQANKPAGESLDHPPPAAATNAFLNFAITCSRIASHAGKLEKVRILAEYLQGLKSDAVGYSATWFSGRAFSTNENRVLQLGWAALRDALTAVGGVDPLSFHQVYLKHSDLGEAAFEILQNRQVAPSLTLEEIRRLFEQLQAARGPLAKTPLLKGALERCTAAEAKYLVKIITGDLRIGLKEGLVEESVTEAFHSSPEAVRQANLLLGDIGETAKLAAENRLAEATLTPFRPIRFMLASPEATPADVWARVQDWSEATRAGAGPADTRSGQAKETSAISGGGQEQAPALSVVAWLEDKYDGVRCQLHKVGARVAMYSRDLKEITATFLELADAARGWSKDAILDGEIVGIRGEQVLPFSELQKRLGRREADLFMHEEVPIKLIVFDLLWMDGESWLNRPLRERRGMLEACAGGSSWLRVAHSTQVSSIEGIETEFAAARLRGNEGLMIKDPESFYAPGRRGLAWLKLKRPYATLDCVVVGAEYGHGKRSKVLSDYTFAVRDEATGQLKTIGKAYSGLTDMEIESLTRHFLSRALRQHGRYFEVPAETVLEIAFDRIQESERHSSGLALRFPRILRIRTDKLADEIDTLATAQRLATQLAKGHGQLGSKPHRPSA